MNTAKFYQISPPSLRDIMAQDASLGPRLDPLAKSPSNLDRRPLASFATTKLSQKERKKQQQMHLQSAPEPLVAASLTPPLPGTRSSPWKTVPKPKSRLNDPVDPQAQSPSPLARSPAPLTMRQTIANPASYSKDSSRSVSSPSVPTVSSTPRKPSTDNSHKPSTPRVPLTPQTTSSPPIQIQSIRHTPRPRRPSFSNQAISMSDIQSQQAAEKERIMGGGEKRSLAEIQAEQEFQEWWDKESARIQNEEREQERQKRRPESSKKRGGGRKGKARAASAAVQSSSNKPSS
jgi:inhibitor of Bruton tyrosine kinase